MQSTGTSDTARSSVPFPDGAERAQARIALLALTGIAFHLVLRWLLTLKWNIGPVSGSDLPLVIVLIAGGGPLVIELAGKMARGQFGSDLLAGISIVCSAALHEYLAGALVVLMLSGGETLEAYAARSASGVLQALARRMPTLATVREGDRLVERSLDQVAIGDTLIILPHGICPVDGKVLEGHGSMDESFLTGEPYQVTKAPGAKVLSGALNGEARLTIRCEKAASDSRYARIMQVMRDSEQHRPQIRRIGDRLGALYTPLAVLIGITAALFAGDAHRFLAVMVVATPCPLLIGIPVAVIGAISLSARNGIIIKNPGILETVSRCRIAIFDKTGTLTYGRPALVDVASAPGFTRSSLLRLVASLEQYSRHPLAKPIVDAALDERIAIDPAEEVSEAPGEGLHGVVAGRHIRVMGRAALASCGARHMEALPMEQEGLECAAVVDGIYAGLFRFRDEPRSDSASFVGHLSSRHNVQRTLLISGDRESEALYLAERVGIDEVHAGATPEDKLALVREETRKGATIFVGDGINDAPALTAATVGIAFGANTDITGEAADAVILDSALGKVDVLLHIGGRMRAIALQSAIGGMALSVVGMAFAAAGQLPPVAGAICQEVIDVLAVLNALRAAFPPRLLQDY